MTKARAKYRGELVKDALAKRAATSKDHTTLDIVDGIQTRIEKSGAIVRALAIAAPGDDLADNDPVYIALCVTDLLREAHGMVEELHSAMRADADLIKQLAGVASHG